MAENPRPTDLESRIRAALARLSPAEARVAELLSEEADRVAQLTVTELAQRASTSAATVVRAAKSLGYDGYPQLRFALAQQTGRATQSASAAVPLVADIVDDDSVSVVLHKLAAFECSQIMATAALTAVAALETVATTMARARRCCMFGVGASGLVAQDLTQKISRIGLTAFAHVEHDAGVAAASQLGPDDVAVAISHAGETPGAVEPLRRARQSGAFTAAITGAPRSALARQADQVVLTAGHELGLRAAAIGSRTSQLLLVDTIFVRVAQLTPQASVALKDTYDAIASTRRASS